MKFTPGQWHVERESEHVVAIRQPAGSIVSVGATALRFRGGRSGAKRGETPRRYPLDAEAIAAAHLIAAAPDLYAALAECDEWLTARHGHADAKYDPGALTMLRTIGEALARARGETE